jgi:hypothetical protein
LPERVCAEWNRRRDRNKIRTGNRKNPLIPTAENIRQCFNFLKGAVSVRDVVILYFAGNGVNDKHGKFFFLPKDAVYNSGK